MRPIRFRAWDGKQMDYDYRDVSLWNGILVAEGDTILMQFTGLTDRLGKDIYEGDILYHDDVRHWPKTVRKMTAEKLAKYPLEPIVVEWNEARAGFDPFVSEDDEQGPRFSPEKIEIVGNIYEHPELTHGKA